MAPKKQKQRFKRLDTAHEVVLALGFDTVLLITGCKYKTSIHNWIKFDQFPSRYYRAMYATLRRRGYSAPHELWDQRGDAVAA